MFLARVELNEIVISPGTLSLEAHVIAGASLHRVSYSLASQTLPGAGESLLPIA